MYQLEPLSEFWSSIVPKLLNLSHQETKSVFRICFANRGEMSRLNVVVDIRQVAVVAEHMAGTGNFATEWLGVAEGPLALCRLPDMGNNTLAVMLMIA